MSDLEKEAPGRGEVTLEIRTPEVAGSWVLEVGNDEHTTTYPLERERTLVLGAGRAADLVLSDRCVSARHCEVRWTGQGVALRDLASKNGLYVGPARVATALLVEDGASFVVGRTTITLRCESDAARRETAADSVPGLIGASRPMRRVAEQIRRYARSRATVLLQGESGTGKDVAARALHKLSGRTGGYVPLNVAAFPESLADSELFGHRRGAYTGALSSRAGAFEQAHQGTLFLDEVADLAPSVQVKLLRVVEDGVVRPIGANEPVTVDTRIVSASWAKLEDRVRSGQFRADLFHRLATVAIALPPLRQRCSDIPALCRVLLARMQGDVGPKTLSSAAVARLVAHDWPGNVRELGSVLYRAALASDSEHIQAAHLELPELARSPNEVALTPEQAKRLLDQHGGNVSRAARAAKVPRTTFRAWLSRTPQPPTQL